MKSKGDGQGLCRSAVDCIKTFDNDGPGRKTFFLPLWPEKNVLHPGSSSSKFQNGMLLIVDEYLKKFQLDSTIHFTWGCGKRFSKIFISYHE